MRRFRPSRWLLLALLFAVIPASSYAGIFISVGFAPPALPVYEQPICPEPNLMWTPGYWAYGEDGYYWVPGTWVPSPYAGALWTPGYWGWSGGLFVFHEGYWGRHIGYYGGVNYGFGYGGIGFAGGEWRGGMFAYNTAVVHVNETIIHTTFVDRTIVERNTIVNDRHVAYSGGPGGINHPPTAEERIAEHEQHVQPTSFQRQHIESAKADKTLYVKNNGGRPATLAVAKPLTAPPHPAGAGAPRGSEISGGRTGAISGGNRAGKERAGNYNSSKPVTGNYNAHAGEQTSGSGAGKIDDHTYNASRSYTGNSTPKPHPPAQQHPAPAPKPKPQGHER
jgi:hypothetical protein